MKRKPKNLLLILGTLLVLSLLLVACSEASTQEPTTNTNTDSDQENQVLLPVVEAKSSTENETSAEVGEEAYPYPAPDVNQEVESYPASEAAAQADTVSESYPAPEETDLKPTPRGNNLVATDPATVKLASGQPQLVEMFAFW